MPKNLLCYQTRSYQMTGRYANRHGPQINEKVYLWLVFLNIIYQCLCFAKSKLLCCMKHKAKSLLQIGIPSVPALGSYKKGRNDQPNFLSLHAKRVCRNNFGLHLLPHSCVL